MYVRPYLCIGTNVRNTPEKSHNFVKETRRIYKCIWCKAHSTCWELVRSFHSSFSILFSAHLSPKLNSHVRQFLMYFFFYILDCILSIFGFYECRMVIFNTRLIFDYKFKQQQRKILELHVGFVHQLCLVCF